MKLFVLVLNKPEKLNELMRAYAREKICGATILESMGMARAIFNQSAEEDVSFFNSVRKFLRHEMHEKNRTVFVIIREDQEELIKRVTTEVVGDFNEPDTGVMFIINLDYAFGKGLQH